MLGVMRTTVYNPNSLGERRLATKNTPTARMRLEKVTPRNNAMLPLKGTLAISVLSFTSLSEIRVGHSCIKISGIILEEVTFSVRNIRFDLTHNLIIFGMVRCIVYSLV